MDLAVEEIIERLIKRDSRRTEAEVQSDIRQLLLGAELNLSEDKLEVNLEAQAGQGHRIDVETGATIIEVKKDLRSGNIRGNGIKQLQGYVESRQQQYKSRYVGVLTDGAEWRCYHLQKNTLVEVSSLVVASASKDGEALLDWLEGVLATTTHVPPSPDNIEKRLGAKSSSHALDVAALQCLYQANKTKPEVQTKRHLWSRLLTAALGTQFKDDDTLFVEHTLLVNSAEIIAQALLGFEVTQIAPASLLSGSKFEESGIYGVVEADFFDWVVFVEGGDLFIHTLAKRLARFDWGVVEHDVLKVLYESIITADTRKQLGEYYTPDWLAQKMVDDLVTAPLQTRLLDPSCGSGTFLFHAVRRYLEAAKAQQMTTAAAIKGVTSHVLGMDLHPVAVTLARVTYLLAIGKEWLTSEHGEIHIPVFLGDSMQWQQKSENLWTRTDFIVTANDNKQELFQRDAIQTSFFPDQLRFPRGLLQDSTGFDGLVKELSTKATDPKRGPKPSLSGIFQRYAIHPEMQPTITKTFQTLCRLHDEGRDHIWGYYVRNLVRPQWLSQKENRVDLLIGNPPWLAYRFMPQDMQATFSDLSKAQNLWKGGKVATQQDLSALFVARTIQLYLKPEGRFGFVMPIAVLIGKQYAGFRNGSFEGGETKVGVRFDSSWDLRRVKPAFFPVSAAVVLGTRSESGAQAMPEETIGWSGRLPSERNASWSQAQNVLKIADPKNNKSTTNTGSPYKERFRNGATIFPRVLFMVEKQKAGPLGQVAGKAKVKSIRSANEKAPWKQLPALEGSVETEFLRSVHLGETVLPYRTLPAPLAVLPRDASGLMDGQTERLDNYPGLASWWRDVEAVWIKHRSSDRIALLQQLDFYGKFTAQFPLAAKRVVYSKSGQYLAAARLNDPRAVIDHTLYWAAVTSDEEAYYLCAIMNAASTTKTLQPLSLIHI